MSQLPVAADFAGAARYALGRLANELSPILYYHGLGHSRDEVLPAAERLALLEGVGGEDLLLLRTAALYHDIGFVERFDDNEVISVRIAESALPNYGYSPAQLGVIRGIIMATRLPQGPVTLLEKIIADADLDVLGREDFFVRNQDLRRELIARGMQQSEAEWYDAQLQFLRSHRYFTESARRLRGEGQHANLDRLEAQWRQDFAARAA